MLAVFLIKVAKLAREAIRVKFVLDLFVIAIIEVFEVSQAIVVHANADHVIEVHADEVHVDEVHVDVHVDAVPVIMVKEED